MCEEYIYRKKLANLLLVNTTTYSYQKIAPPGRVPLVSSRQVILLDHSLPVLNARDVIDMPPFYPLSGWHEGVGTSDNERGRTRIILWSNTAGVNKRRGCNIK